MNKTIYIFYPIIALLFCSSCSSKQKDAKSYLSAAREFYQLGNYESAKLQIDSIKIKFPKAFDEIKEGHMLMQQIRTSENQRNIAYCDSMLQVTNAAIEKAMLAFSLQKDPQYQEIGNYIPKLTPSTQLFTRNTLRSGVSEDGKIYLESIVVGQNIGHRQVRASLSDGSYAETLPVTSDGLNYSFNTIEGRYEIVKYTGKDENGVSNFISVYKNEPITIQCIGRKTISFSLSKNEKEAISQSCELSSLLLERERLKMEKEKSETLLRYLQEKAADK
jgi:hypothetical protein